MLFLLEIHCNIFNNNSAGVGRTGTFICIDNMLRLAAEENIVDVFNYVNYMRLSRYNLVENQVKNLIFEFPMIYDIFHRFFKLN